MDSIEICRKWTLLLIIRAYMNGTIRPTGVTREMSLIIPFLMSDGASDWLPTMDTYLTFDVINFVYLTVDVTDDVTKTITYRLLWRSDIIEWDDCITLTGRPGRNDN